MLELEQPHKDDLSAVCKFLDHIVNGECSIDDIIDSKEIDNIIAKLMNGKSSLEGLTMSQLWILYIDMISILKMFIKFECPRNWLLHLRAVMNVVPIFAKTSLHHYAKRGYLCLQQMEELHEKHPKIYSRFKEGYLVIRWTDRF